MEHIELKMSLNTTGEVSSSNPAVRFVQSKFGATFLLFISLLYPFESFSQNCQLKTAPICIDSTPCKTVVDTAGNNVTTCLSGVVAPPGALVTSASCWQYKAAYDCMNQTSPTYVDTCKPIKDGGKCVNYAEKSVVCNPNEPKLAGGACPLFDVTYQCDVAPGKPYTETTCNSQTSCTDANGNPSFCTGPVTQEINKNFGVAVAGNETAREVGVYLQSGDNIGETDITKLRIFKGEFNRCSEGMWGAAPNCCKQDGRGADSTNALLAQEIVGAAWNAVASQLGNEYVYDSLLTKTIDLLQKGADAIMQAYNGMTTTSTVMTTANNVANIGSGLSAASNSGTLTNIAGGVGGYIGGQLGGQAGSYIAQKNGANTGWAGTISALGTAAGTIIGTYAGVYAATFISSLLAGGTLAAASTAAAAAAGTAVGTSSASLVCWVCLIIMVIVMIIMSFAACSPEDYKTQLKLGAPGICHYVGTYCNTHDFAGGCITTMHSYCCYNSRLAKLVQEGAKPQIPGESWGTPETPNCSGIKVSDLSNVDFSKIDLSEFANDVVVRNIPDGTAQAARAQEISTNFMAVNNFDPTATDGLLITNGHQLPPIAQQTSVGPGTPPAMMACKITAKVTSIAADGSETAQFDVSQCNPGAVIVWNNVGNCSASQPTSMDPASPNYLTSTVDVAGKTTLNLALPGVCFTATTPPTQNVWKGIVTLQPYGTIGEINATW